MKVNELTKTLETMPKNLDVKITSSGTVETLRGTKVLDNVKYFAFDVDYTFYNDMPEVPSLTVGDLLDTLKDVPADYDVGIIAWTVSGGYEGSLDGTWMNSMIIDNVGFSTNLLNTTKEFVVIETTDNDDEERYGAAFKF